MDLKSIESNKVNFPIANAWDYRHVVPEDDSPPSTKKPEFPEKASAFGYHEKSLMSSSRSRDTQHQLWDSKSTLSNHSNQKKLSKGSKLDSRSSIEVDQLRPYSRDSIHSLP